MVVNRIRNFVRAFFSRFEERPELRSARTSTRHKKSEHGPAVVPPSERFVWCITAMIICLMSVVVLEAVYIVVTGKLSTELVTVISGLTGSLTTVFLMGNRT
jgi:hypothetical protein